MTYGSEYFWKVLSTTLESLSTTLESLRRSYLLLERTARSKWPIHTIVGRISYYISAYDTQSTSVGNT